MAYTAWSVVYGEQPTAAKWNQLGANDAGFKDGTNIDDDAIIQRHIADDAVDYNRWTNGIAFRAFPSAGKSMGVNTFTKIDLNSEVYDLGSNFNTALGRFIAPIAGVYHFDGAMYISAGTSASSILALFKNGTEIARGNWLRGGHPFVIDVLSMDLQLVANDYIELFGYTESTAGTAAAGQTNTYLSGHLVSPQ